MAAFSLAVLLLATTSFTPCTLAQGYGGVPQHNQGPRTTTTFAPDVIPSDQQAQIFHQQNPNPSGSYTPPQGPSGTFNPQGGHNNPAGGFNPQGGHNNPAGGFNPQGGHNNPAGGFNPQGGHNNPGGSIVPQGPAGNFNPQGGHSRPQGPTNNYGSQGASNQGPLPDNTVQGSDTQGGNFWWMSQAPFKGAGAVKPQGCGSAGGGCGANQIQPVRPVQPVQPAGPAINPQNPFIHGGGNQPSATYQPSQPSGHQPGQKPTCYQGQNCGTGPQFQQNGQQTGYRPSGQQPTGFPSQAPVQPPYQPSQPAYGGNNNNPGQGLTVTCSAPGHICVAKHACSNGVVNSNRGQQQIHSGAQKCNSQTETCCRLPPQSGGNPPQNNNYPSYQGQGSAPGTNGRPIGGSIYDQYPKNNPVQKPYDGPLNTTPYPGCAAALKCVELIYCTAEGVMTDNPVALTREQEENRVPLSECSNPDTGILGKCCRDPNYKDPWPGGMMMGGGVHVHHDQSNNNNNNNNGGQYFDQAGFPSGQYKPANQFPANPVTPSPSQQHQFLQQAGSVSPGPLITNSQPKPFPLDLPVMFQRPILPDFNEGPQTGVPQQQKPYPQATPPPVYQKPQSPLPPLPPVQQKPYPQPLPQPIPPRQQKPYPQPESPIYQQPESLPQPLPQPLGPFNQPAPEIVVIPQPQPPFYQSAQTLPGLAYQPERTPNTNIQSLPRPGEKCGLRRQVDRSGLSDIDAGFGEFPWHSLVLKVTTKSPLCSAALVSERAVVTSASCVKDVDASDILIEAGVWKLGSRDQTQTSHVAAISRHPQFNEITQFNDMAVLFLTNPVQLTDHVDTICIPRQSTASTNNCVATGFGKPTLQANTPGSTLHQIKVDFISNSVCENKFKQTNLGNYFVLNESFQCVVPAVPAHDLCKVDKGGPIGCDRGDGQNELTGLYSWDTGCSNPTNPTALASTDVAWLEAVLSRPIDEILRDNLNEVEKKKKAHEVVNAQQKPGFSEGYGK